MLDALAAMPASGLLVLLTLAGVAGWWACRGWDALVDGWYASTNRAARGARAAWKTVLRALFGVGALAGALTCIALAYNATH